MSDQAGSEREALAFNFAESSVGIEEYANPALSGFHAIIKARFSDFVVREIDMQGNVVRLRDLGILAHLLQSRARPLGQEETTKDADAQQQELPQAGPLSSSKPMAEGDAAASLRPELTADQLRELERVLGKVYPSAVNVDKLLESVKSLLDGAERERCIHLPAISEKPLRTALHQYFREANQSAGIAGKASFDTLTLEDGQIKVSFGKGLEKKRKTRDTLTESKPKYISFHLLKQNRDTMEAIQRMAVLLRIPSASFSFAGTKDKRGVTVQKVVVSSARIDAPRLASLNRALLGSGLYIGDFEPCSAPLGLGELKGNMFDVFLRSVSPSIASALPAAMDSLKEQGFINYYGMQRFGNAREVPTWKIGLALLKNEWSQAVRAILDPRESDEGAVKEARRAWSVERDACKAYALLPRRWIAERALLRHFMQQPATDALGAILSIPHEMRLMYLHSLQSLVWNKMASKRMALSRSHAIPGDLVLLTTGKQHAAASTASLVKTLSSQDDIRHYSLKDVVLPLPGHSIVYPENEMADHYRSYMEQSLGLGPTAFQGKHFPLAGSYRHLIVRPAALSYQLIGYNDENEAVLDTDLDALSDPEGKTIDRPSVMQAKYAGLRLTFSLPPSAYATMALREILRSETSAHFQRSMTH